MADDREKMIEVLNEIANELQDLPDDESLAGAPKAITRLADKLGEQITFLDENVESFKMKDEV